MRTWTVEAGTPDARPWGRQWFDAWFEALDAGLSHGLTDPVRLQAPEQRADLDRVDPQVRRFVVALEDGGEVVAAGRVHLPLLDNTDVALADLAVPAPLRRRGYGTQLLRAIRDLAAELGRDSLLVELDRPADRPPQEWPGSAFAAAGGLTLRLTSVRRDLALPMDDAVAADLDRRVRAAADGYRVDTWAGPAPVEGRDQLAGLMARMVTDAPMGDLEYEPERWDAARVVAEEGRHTALGRRWWTAVAVAPDGTYAGFCQLGWTPHDPERLHQWDTLVLKEHRGRRLGLAVKLAALRLAAAETPSARLVSTWNAAENSHMIAVNEAMGFRPVDVAEEWQAHLADLRVDP